MRGIILPFSLFYIKFGNKKGFNKLTTLWLIFFILFVIILSKLRNNTERALAINVALNHKILSIPLIVLSGVFVTILGGGYRSLSATSHILYKSCLSVRMKGHFTREPTIYIVNYPSSYIEYLAHGLFGDKVCFLMVDGFYKMVNKAYKPDTLISVKKGSFDEVHEKIKDKLHKGYQIFAYVEREYYNRKNDYTLAPFRSGMFTIANKLNTTITPVVIDHLDHTMGVLDSYVFQIDIGRPKRVKNVEKSMKECREDMGYKLRRMSIKRVEK